MSDTDVVVCVAGGDPHATVRAHTTAPLVLVDSPAVALARAGPADLVLLEPGVRVAAGWLDGLRAAAHASATTATATALTQHDLATAFDPATLDAAAATVRMRSLRLRPRIEGPSQACMYVRRSAIELIGGPGEDFWAQCAARGLGHVLADDVLVLAPRAPEYPTTSTSPPWMRATAAARRALGGFNVLVDARILHGPTTGTHVHVLELLAALSHTEEITLTAILPDQPSEHARARLNDLPEVSLTTYREASGARADVVHRPFQLSNAGDITFLRTLGERLILTQQDLIAFHNPAYFPTPTAWQEHRKLTRAALNEADQVLFFSAHSRDDALAEELVDPTRATVVRLGVDHRGPSDPAAPPPGAERLEARPFLLCLGTDFLHKNRLFALRVLAALEADRTGDANLVFAGPAVAHGSSRAEEQRFLAARAHLKDRVLDLGPVTEPEKNWLYDKAALVLYPSVLEGFGLVPFEAAAHRVPCLWAPGSSLSELLPDAAAGIIPWDETQTAHNALAILQDAGARERNLNAIDAAAKPLTWDATARRLLEAYRATADAPARKSAGSGLALTEDAARLVGPGGELPPEVHRPLLALATHPTLARPVWAALRVGYRASRGLLQRRR